MLTVGKIVEWLNKKAPFDSAEGFDNVGLLLGDSSTEVHNVLFGMDVTENLVKEAIRLKAELIITHHPFIFHSIKRIDYTAPQSRSMRLLMQHGIAVIAAHTNWDKAAGGVGDSLASALSLRDIVNGDDYIRVGTLPQGMSLQTFSDFVKERLGIVPRIYPASDSTIERIAVAGGAYGEGYLLAHQAGAQIYLVGEVPHHEILDAYARGLTVCDAGHFATEWPGVRSLFTIFLTDAQTNHWAVEAYLHHEAPYAGAILA